MIQQEQKKANPIKLLTFQRIQSKQSQKQIKILRNEQLFTLVIISSNKTKNPLIPNFQKSIISQYKDDMKLFKCSSQADLPQIIQNCKTYKLYVFIDHQIDIKTQTIFDSITKQIKNAKKQNKKIDIKAIVGLKQLENKNHQTFFHPLVYLVSCDLQGIMDYFNQQISSIRQLRPADSYSSLNSIEVQQYHSKLRKEQPNFTLNQKQSKSQISIDFIDNGVPGVGTYKKSNFDHRGQQLSPKKDFAMSKQQRKINPQQWARIQSNWK